MTTNMWITFLTFAFITAFTPGPNNILALSATSNYGIKKSIPIILGIMTGFFCVLVLCGIFTTILKSILPSLMIYLRYLGAAYILWLAWHVWKSRPVNMEDAVPNTSFAKGFLLQFINIKTMFYGVTILTTFVLPYYSSVIAVSSFVVLITLIGMLCVSTWALAGFALNKVLNKYWRVTNIVTALLLVYNAICIVLK